MAKIKVPTYDTFMNPLVQALKSLGGAGTIEEIQHGGSQPAHFAGDVGGDRGGGVCKAQKAKTK
jgi:hypothetical protein